MIPVYVGGECAGANFVRINIYTLAIIESTISDGLISLFIKWYRLYDRLAKYGELFTGIMANNAIGKAFVERCGFTVYDSDANVVIYRLSGV